MAFKNEFRYAEQLGYELFESSEWNTIELAKIKENETNSVLFANKDRFKNIYDIRKYANYYATRLLYMTQDEYYNQFRKNYNKEKSGILDEETYLLFEKIIDLNLIVSSHLYDEIKKHTKSHNELHNRNFLCSLIYPKGDNKSLLEIFFDLYQPENSPKKKEIQKNIKSLIDDLSVNYQEDNYFPILLIQEFLSANLQNEEELLEFCKRNYITLSDLEQSIFIMSYTNKEIYERSKELYKKIYVNNHQNHEEYNSNTRKIGKKCYEYFMSVRDVNKLYDLVTEKLSIGKIRKAIKLYMVNDLNMLESDFYYLIHHESHKALGKNPLVLDELSDASFSITSLLTIIKKYYYNIYDTTVYKMLLDGIYPYILRRTKMQTSDTEELEYNLNKKVNLVREYILEKRKERRDERRKEMYEQLVPKAIQIIKDFVSQDISLNKYISINNITLSDYHKYRDIVKEYDNELYQLLINKNERSAEKHFIIKLTQTRSIISMIINGIEIEGKKRPFDILDYYQYIKINPEELYNQLKTKLSKEEIKAFKTFIAKNKSARKLKTNNVIEERQTILVNGKLHEVTFEEKDTVLNYLKQNNMPLTDKIYYIAIKRYLSGELQIGDTSYGADEVSHKHV